MVSIHLRRRAGCIAESDLAASRTLDTMSELRGTTVEPCCRRYLVSKQRLQLVAVAITQAADYISTHGLGVHESSVVVSIRRVDVVSLILVALLDVVQVVCGIQLEGFAVRLELGIGTGCM